MTLEKRTLRSKVKGMIFGGAIGDARGLPFETMTMEQIAELDPNSAHRYFLSDSRYFKDLKLGDVSDDTQLTIATMQGLIDAGDFDLSTIGWAHVAEMETTTKGWGKTTKEAIQRIQQGFPVTESGKLGPNRGTGNGVVMKQSPLAAWWASSRKLPINQKVVDYAAMTHATTTAAYSALIHHWTIYDLLYLDPTHPFNVDGLLDIASFVANDEHAEEEQDRYRVDHLEKTEGDIFAEINKLWTIRNRISELTPQQIREMFGGGTSYVCHSLPTSYAYFYRNPHSFQTILDVIRSGGDTDSNGAIVGNLIGAYHGFELFEEPENRWALDGLRCREELEKLVESFCNRFGI